MKGSNIDNMWDGWTDGRTDGRKGTVNELRERGGTFLVHDIVHSIPFRGRKLNILSKVFQHSYNLKKETYFT